MKKVNVTKKPELEFEFFDIDKTRLDEEWTNQPKIYFEYASKLAKANSIVEQAKAEADVVKAEVASKIRNDPKKYGGKDKLSETQITVIISSDKKYQEALQVIRSKKYKADILSAAVWALDHRKKALENLVYLHGQNYFSTPQAKGENAKLIVEDLQNEAKKKRRQNSKRGNK